MAPCLEFGTLGKAPISSLPACWKIFMSPTKLRAHTVAFPGLQIDKVTLSSWEAGGVPAWQMCSVLVLLAIVVCCVRRSLFGGTSLPDQEQ